MIKDIPMNQLRDVNIDIEDPKTVIEEVIVKLKNENLKNVTILLCSDSYSFDETVQLINSTWKPEYTIYFKENNIELETITPKRSYEIEKTRKVNLKNN